MFRDCERVHYEKAPVLETVCQLRFPTILSINSQEPAAFQERIRRDYPRYSRNIEKLPPKITNGPNGVKAEPQPDVTNYQFLSADGRWKVNMTQNFIALATPAYRDWETFAGKLDEILAQFIEVYHPAYFERIGLRYINAISRKALDLEDVPMRELLEPAYLGLMAEEDVNEPSVIRMTQTAEMKLPGGCQLKLTCGPGMVKRGNVEDKEVKLLLDIDVFMLGKVEMKHSAAALMTAHTNANRIFRGAITKTLHDAMEPRD